MQVIFQWLRETFVQPSSTQTIVAICLVCAVGLLLGKIRFGKVALGVTFVFFTGILLAHLGLKAEHELLLFAQSLGLVLFVYALGLEVGPSFFPSLKNQGVGYNLYGVLLMAVTYVFILLFHYAFDVSMPNMLGIMSGAVTNTPVLAAVQSTLQTAHPEATREIADVALAGAVTYPLGIVGVILAFVVLDWFRPKDAKQERGEFREAFVAEFEVITPGLNGISVREVVKRTDRHFIISRIWREGRLIVPNSQSELQVGDHLLILSREEDVDVLTDLFGKREEAKDWNRPDINWDGIDPNLVSKRLIITNPKLNGAKLGSLKLRNRYGINITRIDRAGIELLPNPDLYLQHGDRLTVVGEAGALSQVGKLMGDSIQMLDKPKLVSFFFGLLLGCALGTIPVFIPGMSIPIRLGLAGGPIIVGILMGAFGPRFRLATYMTNSATQLIKQLGIAIFFAALGLSSGEHFVETLVEGGGFLWVGLGFFITVVPTVLVGIFALKVRGKSYDEVAGFLSGTMANPMALDFAAEQTDSRTPSVAYATVYPVAMFVRIITAQILLLFFL